MLDIHKAALNNNIASYHEFLSRYSKTKNIVYGFVEGKDDLCFYRGFIENQISGNWEVELWAAGGKDQVYRIHSDIDWRRFPKKRICFFVDRDLSEYTSQKIPQDTNVYVTDGYSIENSIVTQATCRRVLTEVCGFGNMPHGELDQVCNIFDRELKQFLLALIPIMAWILFWRKSGKRANLNDIIMRHLFFLKNGCLNQNATPKGKTNIIEYIHGQCNVAYDQATKISTLEAGFRTGGLYQKFSRGKYVFWFLVEFCLSVRKNAKTLFNSCTKTPPMNVTLSPSNGMIVIGNRARTPNSLRKFLNATYCNYIIEKVA